MAKAKAAVQFSCSECGYVAGRWFGKCPGCDAFGTLVEETVAPAAAAKKAAVKPLLRLVDVAVQEAARIETGVPELDRVLGGGLVPASLVLVGGEPGVGKSTMLLMALRAMSRDRRVLLVTGEESTAQVKLRADRLGGADAVEILAETDLAVALAIASAARRIPVKGGIAAFGEIGLTGRLRPAAQAERRLEECAKLGLRGVVVPSGTSTRGKIPVAQAETLRQAIKAGLDGGADAQD
ncbi:MAG: ATPase domain-containing protein [Actinomycetota bacterium]